MRAYLFHSSQVVLHVVYVCVVGVRAVCVLFVRCRFRVSVLFQVAVRVLGFQEGGAGERALPVIQAQHLWEF